MYYIDFDNTLYETGRLTKDVLMTFARVIGKSKKINPNLVFEELKNLLIPQLIILNHLLQD